MSARSLSDISFRRRILFLAVVSDALRLGILTEKSARGAHEALGLPFGSDASFLVGLSDRIVRAAQGFHRREFAPEAVVSGGRARAVVSVLSAVNIRDDQSSRTEPLSYLPQEELAFTYLGRIFSPIAFGKGVEKQKGEALGVDFREKFQKEFDAVTRAIAEGSVSFDAALSLYAETIRTHLWCVGVSDKSAARDVSLWEHASLTAAIADSLWNFCAGSGGEADEETFSETLQTIESNPDGADAPRPFRLLIGEFGGIQRYIFDIHKYKSAAKRLKARSFLVQMLAEDIKKYALRELGLSPFSVIMNAGGKFILLLPNTADIERKVMEIRRETERRVFDRYKGELRFVFASSDPFSGNDFGADTFGRYFDDAFFSLAREKFHPFSLRLRNDEGWIEDCFVARDLPDDEGEISGRSLCKLCKKYITDTRYGKVAAKYADEPDACRNCGEEILIGKVLRKRHDILAWKSDRENTSESKEKTSDDDVDLLFSRLAILTGEEGSGREREKSFADHIKESLSVTVLESDKRRDLSALAKLGAPGIERRFFATSVPLEEEKADAEGDQWVKDFETMLDEEWEKRNRKGLRKIAILKGDVDNLGKIFSFGLKNFAHPERNAYTASRLKTLSLSFNIFFEGYVDFLARTEKQFENLYIVYSGGDDFTIVGYWETLIAFALRLRKDLAAFARNEQVHFSAAIHLMDLTSPLFAEMRAAESELKAAKDMKGANDSRPKNALSLFGVSLPWSEFEDVKTLANEFHARFLENGEVSMGYLNKLREIAAMKNEEAKREEGRRKGKKNKIGIRLRLWKPYLCYHTERLSSEGAEQWAKQYIVGEQSEKYRTVLAEHLDVFATYLLYKNRS